MTPVSFALASLRDYPLSPILLHTLLTCINPRTVHNSTSLSREHYTNRQQHLNTFNTHALHVVRNA